MVFFSKVREISVIRHLAEVCFRRGFLFLRFRFALLSFYFLGWGWGVVTAVALAAEVHFQANLSPSVRPSRI